MWHISWNMGAKEGTQPIPDSLKPQGTQYESNRGVSRLETAPGAPMVAPGRCELVVPLEPKHQNPSCRDLKQRNQPIPALLQAGEGAQGSPAATPPLASSPGGPVGLSCRCECPVGVAARHTLNLSRTLKQRNHPIPASPSDNNTHQGSPAAITGL